MSKGWLPAAAFVAGLQAGSLAAEPGRAPPSRGLDLWPLDLAEQARAIHRNYCLELGRIVTFQGGQAACEQHQERFLEEFCSEEGRSRANPRGPDCLAEVEQDARAAIEEARWDLGINRLPWMTYQQQPRQPPTPTRPAPAAAPAPRPAPAARLAPMPASVATAERSARDIFAEARASVWVLVALSPERPGEVSQGSAVAVSPRHLLTTCHVVEGRSVLAVVQGNVAHPVTISLSDAATDRCVLATESAVLRPVRAVRRRAEVEVGERVHTIAAPSGLELTLGDGLVSSLRVTEGVPTIQTTALISPGSSGGALFDARGNLIGIISSRLRNAPTIGFAIGADSFWTLVR